MNGRGEANAAVHKAPEGCWSVEVALSVKGDKGGVRYQRRRGGELR